MKYCSARRCRSKSIVAPDQWWLERRIVVRKLLDANDARGAYRVAAEAVQPESENYKADQQFTAGDYDGIMFDSASPALLQGECGGAGANQDARLVE